MLSSNSTLQNGRYRIIGQFGSNAEGRMYDCYDDQLGLKIVMHESPGSDDFGAKLTTLKGRRLEGVIRVRDGFSEGGNNYLVTEAVESRASRPDFVNQPAASVGRLVRAIESLIANGIAPSMIDLAPLHIRLSQDGNNSLVHFGSSVDGSRPVGRNESKLTPFGALETIWSGLDLVTQKAIANSYDEASLEVLESPADERTCIYSLGASIYSVVSGKTPPDALVRMIEVLDGNPDPLKNASDVRPDVNAQLSNVLVKMLELKREDRYQTIGELVAALDQIATTPVKAVSPTTEDDLDELDLLEIPEIETRPTAVGTPHVEPPFPVAMMEAASVEEDSSKIEPAIASAAESVEKWLVETNVEPEPEKPIAKVESEIKTVPENKPEDDQAVPITTSFSFEEDSEAKSSSSKKFMVAGAAGAVLIAGAIWGIMSFSTSATTQVSAQSEISAPVQKMAESEPKPAAETNAAIETLPVTNTVADEKLPEVLPAEVRADQQKAQKRPVIAEVKPEKPVLPKPEKPKKSVTVDDLIRDN